MVEKLQEQGFEISGDFAQRLQRAGISQAQARQLFTTAQTELPRLQELQARGGVEQPEQFTLEQFTEAAVFKVRRIGRNTKIRSRRS